MYNYHFNYKLLSFLIVITVISIITGCSVSNSKKEVNHGVYYPDKTWKQIQNLKEAGWLPAKLKEAHEYAKTLNMAAVVIISHGKIVQKWGNIYRKIPCHSIRKSLLSAMYGPWVQKDVIDLPKTLADLDINDIPPKLSKEEQQATIKELLEARSGVYHKAAFETKSMEAARPPRGSHAPGTFWYYNNWDFNVLGFIYRKLTGKDIFQSFYNMIAKPIGMKDFNPVTDGRYVYDYAKSKYPAYPFTMNAMELARFGLLMARDGKWKSEQIIPQIWVKKSTTAYSKAGVRGGYGYMWWVSLNGKSNFPFPMPHGLYTARGYRGHVLAVIPDLHLVFVYRNDDSNGNKSTSSIDIGKLLRRILFAKNISTDN